MSRTAAAAAKKDVASVDIVAVKRHNGPITLPEELDLMEASKALAKMHAAQEQTIKPRATIRAFPWETARALKRVLEARFGMMTEKTTFSFFFGPQHPAAVQIDVGPGQTEFVPWGAPIEVPGLSGHLEIEVEWQDGMMGSAITGEIKRLHEGVFAEIAAAVRQDIEDNNIYRGKVLRVAFDDAAPKITFEDTSKWDVSRLRWSQNITQTVETRVLGYIRNIELYRKAGVRSRRGVIGAGGFGTGKTKLGWLITKVAEEANTALSEPWTVLWLDDVSRLEDILKLGTARWGRLIVITEDLDRITSGQRDEEMDTLSQAIDGSNNNGSDVLLYATTNNYDDIHEVFKRDGRFDVKLHMTLPDVHAVEQLLWAYGGDLIADGADLSEAAFVLEGITPAAIENVVSAAKEAYINRTGSIDFQLNGDDLLSAAFSVKAQHAFSQRTDTTPKSKEELFGQELAKGLASGFANVVEAVVTRKVHLLQAERELEEWEQRQEPTHRLAAGAAD